MLKEYKDDISSSNGFLLTEFNGLTVEQFSQLREELEKNKARYKVCKNRLAKLAFAESNIEGLDEVLKSSTGMIFIKEDIILVAKILKKFEKELKPIKTKAGFLEGRVLADTDIIDLSKIASREELIAKLLMCMQSPISGLVVSLNAIISKFVYALNAIKEKKEEQE